MGAFGRQILRRLALVVALAVGALSMASSGASAQEMPRKWDPRLVAVNREAGNTFLLRPGQILAGPGDAAAVREVLSGWKVSDRPYGLTLFTRTPVTNDPAKEIRDALARIRRATINRPQGPAAASANHVFVGEAAASAINFMGEPRIQGGPGSTVRPAKQPGALPERGSQPLDGMGVRIAVLDTGMFEHEWLRNVQQAPNSTDTWDADGDGYGDGEAGHGTFIAGLIGQVAPSAEVYAVKVLDSHGVGDDLSVATAMSKLPADIDVINLSLGGYTDKDAPPMAVATAMQAMGKARPVVVAAAGNHSASRPFWPAAFPQVLAVGAVEQHDGVWSRAPYSNHGRWVDATARGTNLQSTFTREKTLLALGSAPSPFDPTIYFDGWASWDGTSFATPITAAMIARTMTRTGLSSAHEGETKLIGGAPLAPQPDFPRAVLIDELEGQIDPLEHTTRP